MQLSHPLTLEHRSILNGAERDVGTTWGHICGYNTEADMVNRPLWVVEQDFFYPSLSCGPLVV
jgi:hypothetical protein